MISKWTNSWEKKDRFNHYATVSPPNQQSIKHNIVEINENRPIYKYAENLF